MKVEGKHTFLREQRDRTMGVRRRHVRFSKENLPLFAINSTGRHKTPPETSP